MSHQLATPAAGSTRRTAQAFRYSAIVTASMASIGLTVAAGSYIANEMAHEPGKLATTPPSNHPALIELGGGNDPSIAQPTAPLPENVGLAALFTPRPAEQAAPRVSSARVSGTGAAAATEVPRPVGGQLRLGTAYLGAHVAAAQHDSVTLTVDTNVFATLADVLLHTPLGEQLGINSDPSANTQLRTEVDSHGDVTLTVSDPGLGRYGVQIARHPVPAPVEDSTAVAV
ncbi:hypothetical protein VMT65_34060 [Nocardia sp. CDC153]|uniref:hypothetical protein n=1 Tax=Nocardia sp. CDC153 TaxID=3112167 RepID=UPI002DB9B33C|nr:hypothetical protein [Nocardia sp. CDC153]MEC3958103.1 hypothetical protein [Nocardia sp. CDC153]